MEDRIIGIVAVLTIVVTIVAGCLGFAVPAVASSADIWTVDAIRACTLVLAADADMDQWGQCVETVGDQHPANPVILRCTSTIRWHSQTNGRIAGLKIGECFKKGE